MDGWPGLQGLEHFYGFIGGETNQWQPPFFRDTTPVEMEIPKGKEGHYTPIFYFCWGVKGPGNTTNFDDCRCL